ncbi:MAG: hypothetical protein U9Q67_03470 [Patescibacteria group bacterium]|nr:hypothetical protein [Patescibacteria group bacterium]
MLHILYRASDCENPKVRPSYFSKALCLKSLIQSIQQITNYRFSFYYDSPVVPEEFSRILKKINSPVIKLPNLGNSGSFWHVYKDAIEIPPEDWVYFVEDDYIHKEDSIKKLTECINHIEVADYITLFDHPVRYATDDHFGLDVPHRNNTIYITESHHWRTQESTCMTFAAKAKTLKKDYDIFNKYICKTDAPEDRELFKRLQGLPGYENGSPFRTLIGPIPSLSTHCHIPWMAPVVDWEKIAKSIK